MGGKMTFAPVHEPRFGLAPSAASVAVSLASFAAVQPGWSAGTTSMWSPPSLTFLAFIIQVCEGSGLRFQVTSPSVLSSGARGKTTPSTWTHGDMTTRRCGSCTPACGSERQYGDEIAGTVVVGTVVAVSVAAPPMT